MGWSVRSWRMRACASVLSVFLLASVALQSFPAIAVAAEPSSATSTTADVPAGAVEQVAKRDAFTKVYRLSDGTMRSVVSASPVNYRADDGSWKTINTTLVPDSDGTLGEHTAAAGAEAHFNGPTDPGAPVKMTNGSLAVSIDMLGVAEGAHAVLGDTADYSSVTTATDLVYTAQADRLKQSLVLHGPDAPSSFAFALGVSGGRLLRTLGGWAVTRGESDEPVYSLGKIEVADAAGARCESATLDVVPTAAGATVTYRVPRSWLEDPSRSFPVIVDPTLSVDQDTYINSIGNTTAHGGEASIKIGYSTTTGYNYGLVRFDCASFSGAKVLDANYTVYCDSTSNGTHTYLGRNTSYWSESWRYSDGRPTYAYLATKTLTAPGPVTWDVSSVAQEWADGTGAPSWYGLQMYQSSTDASFHYKSFCSSENADTTKRPKLVVDYSFTPDPVTDVSGCTNSALDWWRASDSNGDGVADRRDDVAKAGRGVVDLSWPAAARAAGYKIMMFDGRAYQQVGEVFGKDTTTWSSLGCGIWPTDSQIEGWGADGTYTGNGLTLVATPRAATLDGSISLAGASGAGLVLTDGTYLYTKRWSSYPGTTSWHKTGSGLCGTVAGQDYGAVGAGLPDAVSAFSMDGFLYNGYATSPTTVQGTWKGAAAGSQDATTLAFSAPLLDRATGAELTGASGNVLLASDGQRIYSIAYGIGGSSAKNGYTVRVFDKNGTKIGTDHTIPMTSEMIDGVLCDGQALYLMQWTATDGAHVTKVRLSDYAVADQWSIDQGTTRAIGGCYDAANNAFWLGALDTGKVYRYDGSGLDLRDDPERMYQKMSPSNYATHQNYWFRIVPFNDQAQTALADCTAYMPTLQNRTVAVAQDPRHTTADLGQAAGHTFSGILDKGALGVNVTDLSVPSVGPDATLSREYDSRRTAAGLLADAPGWRFSFERSIEATSGGQVVTYRDEDGEAHDFALQDGAYLAPAGDDSTLATDTIDGKPSWVLTDTDRTRDVFDMADGRLVKTCDKSGNAVVYAWTADSLTITAANGQSIVVGLSNGQVQSASYATADGTRSVAYSTSGTPQVTYYPGDPASYTVRYAYSAGKLSGITVPDYPSAGTDAQWGFSYYADGRFSKVTKPSDPSGMATQVSYDAASATVSETEDVTDQDTGETWQNTSVSSTYTWNPTGTMATKTDPYVDGTVRSTWSYAYGPDNDVTSELSPTGKRVSREYDTHGNVLYEWDELGRRTAYRYDALDQLVSTTDPRGDTTYDTYGTDRYQGTGLLVAEERVLTAAGQRSRTEYDHDTAGRTTEQRVTLAPGVQAVTRYGDFAANGEPQTTTEVGVALSVSGQPEDLVTRKTYDAFGDVLTQTDACGITTETDRYDTAGRQTSSVDASGTATRHGYDALGDETLSYRQAVDGTQADRVAKRYDASSRLVEESYETTDAAGAAPDRTVTHTYDAAGRELQSDDSKVSGAAITCYDARGDVVRAWDEGSDTANATAATRSRYDAYGQLTAETAPGALDASSTVNVYNADGTIQKTTEPDGSWTGYVYDEGGLKVAETKPTDDPDNPIATVAYAYDTGGRLVASTAENGATTAYGYDLADRQVSAKAEDATATTTEYNAAGWVLRTTDADGILTTDAYDVDGRVVSQSVAGQTSTTAYDGCGRTVRTTDPTRAQVRTAYDAFGRSALESQLSSAGVLTKTTTTSYDALSRPLATTVTDLLKHTTTTTRQSYPSSGTADTLSVSSRPGAECTVTVDAAGHETARDASTAAGALSRTTSGFDAAGRPTGWVLRGIESSQAFDSAGHLVHQGGEGWGDTGTAYGYLPNNSLKFCDCFHFAYPGQTGTGISETNVYHYTDTGRLYTAKMSGVTTTYTCDPVSGSLTASATGSTVTSLAYDPGTGLLSQKLVDGVKVLDYRWDTAKGRRLGQGSESYSYDAAGHLVGYTDTARGISATYAYDAAGQRSSSTVTQGGATTRCSYSYDGFALQRYDATRTAGSAETTWSVTYLTDADSRPYAGVYESADATPVAFGIVTTDRGDVRELTDASGTPFAFYSYDAYGNPAAKLSQATSLIGAQAAAAICSGNVVRYAGYVYDQESGLYYLSARCYDPSTASFLTKDPADADGEESPYQYCGGDPVGKVDPSGLHTSVLGKHTHFWGYPWTSTFYWTPRYFVKCVYVGSRVKHNGYYGHWHLHEYWRAFGDVNSFWAATSLGFYALTDLFGKAISAGIGVLLYCDGLQSDGKANKYFKIYYETNVWVKG